MTGTSREAEEKKAIARLCGELQRGRLSRRKFLSRLGYLGITAGFGPTILAACGGGEGEEEDAPLGGGPEKVQNWLKDVGGPFKGTTLHIVSEATPPSRAILSMAQDEFEPATGMTIDWELLPLDQVLQKISVDASGKQGQYDMYYLDQAWIARFKNDTIALTT